jgi:predicted phage tail protein
MIKIKFSFDNTSRHDRELEIIDGELISDLVPRVLSEIPMPKDKFYGDVFQVLINGHKIESDMWPVTAAKKEDRVLIAPLITSGDSGGLFKQVLIIAIAVVASVFLSPAVGGGIYGALAVSAVTIGASLALNALIPPPVPEGLGTLGGQQSYESSQMYTLTGQSNTVRRFETVPRVYGKHRIFPNVAATPYTELETDPVTGELVQYLYAIYDFGMGPASVSNLMIGDTPFNTTNFKDFDFNFVDLNRPVADEGTWDKALQNDFTIYKGDNEGEQLGVGLDGNKNDGDPQDTWEAIRNSAPNSDGSGQEISLGFTNPIGLYGFSATGVRDYRQIDLDISFSKVGENVWRKWNDMAYVSTFTSAGGDTVLYDIALEILLPTSPVDSTYFVITDNDSGIYKYSVPYSQVHDFAGLYVRLIRIGLNGNQKGLVVKNRFGLQVGAPVFRGPTYIGTIASISVYGPDNTYRILTMEENVNPYISDVAFFYQGQTNPAENYRAWTNADRFRSGTNTLGRARIKRSDTAPVYSTFKFTPKAPGQYKVRVQRLATSGPYTTNVADRLTWTGITTRFARPPVITEKRHVFMELRIRATSQLNGTLSNLSGVVSSVLDVYDGSNWEKQYSSNPAWVFCDLLTGQVNKKAVDKSRLHMDSIMEWAEFCDEIPDPPPGFDYVSPRFSCNFVLDYASSLQNLLGQVCGASQSSLNIIDGRYGVLVDRLKTVPVQIFTPRNSREFSSSRIYSSRPHGLNIKYINPANSWEVAEVTAYDDGYDKDNATLIEDMTSFACTVQEQAWRFGRFMIAQNKLRQETMSITVDFEHLVCTRGDYVQLTQDVMRVGGFPARVKTVAGNTITINDDLDIDPLLDYGFTFRAKTGQIYTSTLTALEPDTFELDGPNIPEAGDLIAIGVMGQIVYDCIVKSISPNDDMSAQIVLVEKADGIYDYESTGDIPEYDPQISQTSDPNFAAPGPVKDLTVADFGYECSDMGIGYDYFVDLVWGVPDNSIYEYFSILADTGRGYSEVGTTRSTLYRYAVSQSNLGAEINFKVLAVSATGKKIDLGSAVAVSATVASKSTPPSNVENLATDITNEVIQLSWPQLPDCDVREYLIRYSPLVSGASWQASIPLLRIDRNGTLASAQARTGTYLIKAVDFNGNESADAAIAITSIPNLFNLNIIETVSDSPDWEGGFDRVVNVGGALILDNKVVGGIDTAEYYEEGIYYYSNLVDLGAIYTARIQSQVQAEGYTVEDVMENWVTLDSVVALANSRYSEWDVITEYRGTNELNVIANWVTLDSITALNEGATESFTEWRPFIMGDVTARVLQFRLKLISRKPSVSPRVFSGTIKVDMPDRIESYQNQTVDAMDGLEILYDPPFKGPTPSPNVQVSIDGAESGDYWEFDYKDVNGLLIRIYDKNDDPVSRVVDIAVKGYGRLNNEVI